LDQDQHVGQSLPRYTVDGPARMPWLTLRCVGCAGKESSSSSSSSSSIGTAVGHLRVSAEVLDHGLQALLVEVEATYPPSTRFGRRPGSTRAVAAGMVQRDGARLPLAAQRGTGDDPGMILGRNQHAATLAGRDRMRLGELYMTLGSARRKLAEPHMTPGRDPIKLAEHPVPGFHSEKALTTLMRAYRSPSGHLLAVPGHAVVAGSVPLREATRHRRTCGLEPMTTGLGGKSQQTGSPREMNSTRRWMK